MFFVEPDRPRVTETAAGSSLCGDALLKRQRRPRPEAFQSRIVVTQNVGDDCCRLRRCNAGQRMMFTSQKFCAYRGPATSQSRISSGEIDQSHLSISQNKTGAVIRESLRKVEAPFLELIKFR